MKGFVPTPASTVDMMVQRLFQGKSAQGLRLLDPGCGHGAFIEGVIRWCAAQGCGCPEIVGIELDPEKLAVARARVGHHPAVRLLEGDFLTREFDSFDLVVGNPPYVGIEDLSEEERAIYRGRFATARGRLDLYLMFWEKALRLLKPDGRIVFITPEKFTYVETARPLRKLMALHEIEEIQFVPEDTFPGLLTYPAITSITRRATKRQVLIRLRDGATHMATLPLDGESWQAAIHRSPGLAGTATLEDVAVRISCGVATGSDKTYLFRPDDLPPGCEAYSRPVIAGRELRPGSPMPAPRQFLLMPYDGQGRLLPLEQMGSAADYLRRPAVRRRLEARTCAERKPWYAFHETPPLRELLRPKLICKDIAKEPFFWIDYSGHLVPLHSTYYIVPFDAALLEPLARFLNSSAVKDWLRANSHRAANGYVRVQSAILKRLPVPEAFAGAAAQQRLAA